MKKFLAILMLISLSKSANAATDAWTRQISAVYSRPGYTVVTYPDGRVEAFATDTGSGRLVFEHLTYDPGQTNPPDQNHRLGPAVTVIADRSGTPLLKKMPLDGLPRDAQDAVRSVAGR